MSREQHLKISCFILRLFLKEIMKDGKIEAFEKEGLQSLVHKLGIPSDMARTQFDEVRSTIKATSDAGAIDYSSFFTQLYDNLTKILPADGVDTILNQVAVLLKAQSELAVFALAMDVADKHGTIDLGDGLYDSSKDIFLNGFQINDIDLTNAEFVKGGK